MATTTMATQAGTAMMRGRLPLPMGPGGLIDVLSVAGPNGTSSETNKNQQKV